MSDPKRFRRMDGPLPTKMILLRGSHNACMIFTVGTRARIFKITITDVSTKIVAYSAIRDIFLSALFFDCLQQTHNENYYERYHNDTHAMRTVPQYAIQVTIRERRAAPLKVDEVESSSVAQHILVQEVVVVQSRVPSESPMQLAKARVQPPARGGVEK